MLVELDIFSGRPNPRWELNATQHRRLRTIHERLPQIHDAPPEPPGLGYRGFCYTLDGASCRVFNGAVTGPGSALRDVDRELEHLLLATIPDEYAALRQRVGQLLDPTA